MDPAKPEVTFETGPDAEPADADAVLDGLASILADDPGGPDE